jgi:hypothetical protein
MFRYIVQEGWTDTASWLIILREDFELFEAAAKNPRQGGPNAERLFNAYLTVRHETVHFWHAISTNFLYSYSCNYLNRCVDVLKTISNGKRAFSEAPFLEFQPYFKELTDLLVSPSDPVRTIDVIEGCAVLCAYRMHYPQASHEGFLRHLQQRHYGQREYEHAYLAATHMLGEHAFDLFSPACYLALQGDNPGSNFVHIIHFARDAIHSFDYRDDPLAFLLEITQMSEEGCFPSIIKAQGVPTGFFSHPILQPYLERIAGASGIRAADVFARPYHYEPENSPRGSQEIEDFLSDIVPPIHIYTGRRALLMGLGQKLGKDYGAAIHHLTTLVGVAARLVFGINGEMLCPHRDCPVYPTNLCQKYLVFPLDDYRKCAFPEVLNGFKLGSLLNVP